MRPSILTILFVVLVASSVVAQNNFSGTWIYDKAASSLPFSGGPITITHTGNCFTIVTESPFGTVSSSEWLLDGVEHVVVSERGSTTYTAVLNGNTLRVTGAIKSATVTRAVNETFILSGSGDTLVREVTVNGRKGPEVRKLVFHRQ
jgi:hypothetical protein